MEISELINQAKNGDKEALLSLVTAQQADYYKLAYVYMKNKEDTLDALQDMIMILYENIYQLKKGDAFYSWSKTILVNTCRNKLKRNKKLISIEEIKEQSVDDIYNTPEDKIVLDKYISKLSLKHQEVIKLRYYLDLDYENIGRILNIPLGTVKSRLNVGLKKLKEALGGEYIE
mgnify:CR=1 FL=1